MKTGDRIYLKGSSDYETLAFIRQMGGEGVQVNVSGEPFHNESHASALSEELVSNLRTGSAWKANDLSVLREEIAKFDLEVFALGGVPRHRYQKLLLGRDGRDEEIENWCESLRAMGEAGIPILQYVWHLNDGAKNRNWHTSLDIPIRGGAHAEGFDISKATDPANTTLGPVSDEQLWESLEYFLKAVIPVAEEAGVRMALHPADPQVPRLAGIARILRSPVAIDRFLELVPSPANAINFCQGCFTQMLEPPDVYHYIQKYASQGSIAFVHCRNVVGTADKFQETFWDEGKLDMVKAMQSYHKGGYDGYFTPDHHPYVIGDTKWGHRARGFALGYMKGLIQSVKNTSTFGK